MVSKRSLLAAVKAEDEPEALRRLAEKLAARIQACRSDRDLPPLTRALAEVMDRLRAYAKPDVTDPEQVTEDELARRREDREPDAPVRARSRVDQHG